MHVMECDAVPRARDVDLPTEVVMGRTVIVDRLASQRAALGGRRIDLQECIENRTHQSGTGSILGTHELPNLGQMPIDESHTPDGETCATAAPHTPGLGPMAGNA
jgi:hypothetical protein